MIAIEKICDAQNSWQTALSKKEKFYYFESFSRYKFLIVLQSTKLPANLSPSRDG
jgi:hypothetical protein